MSRPLPDPGLQPERTELAWRRTGLSFLVGVLALTRLGQAALGIAALATSAMAVAGMLVLDAVARARLRGVRQALAAGGGPRTGGRALLALAATATAIAVVALLLTIAAVGGGLSG